METHRSTVSHELDASLAHFAPQTQLAVHPAGHERAVGEVPHAAHPLAVAVRGRVEAPRLPGGCDLYFIQRVVGGLNKQNTPSVALPVRK